MKQHDKLKINLNPSTAVQTIIIQLNTAEYRNKQNTNTYIIRGRCEYTIINKITYSFFQNTSWRCQSTYLLTQYNKING